MQNLMEMYWKIGRPRATLNLEGRCIELAQGISNLGDEAACLRHAGIAYRSLGETRKAIDYHEKSLAMRERVYVGRDHPDIAQSLNNLGVAYELLGEYRKAIGYYEKSLVMRERVYAGSDHPEVARSLRNLANAHEKAGNAMDAARYRECARAMTQRMKGK